MSARRIETVSLALGLAFVLVACGDSDVVDPGPAAAEDATVEAQARPGAVAFQLSEANAQLASLYALQAAFHEALNQGDKEAVRALWAPDAVVWAGAVGCLPCIGPDEIADAIATSGPFVNQWASLAPSYKTAFDVHGNTAEYQFECVYLTDVGPGESLAGPVHAHLNATGTMRKVGDRWLFQSFQAGLGSL